MAEQQGGGPAADAAYRRGTVLGLTVAEVFVLLLFLLMLAFLGLVQSPDEAVRLEAEYRKTAEALDQTQEVLTTVRDRYEPWEEVIREFKAPDEIVTLQRAKAAAEREAARARRVAEVARAQAEEALGAEAVAKRELRVMQEKGQNPPCWYQRVPDGRDGLREKPYYTFDVAVFERHMVLRRAPTPPGGADDDTGGTYQSEAFALGLERLPYGTELSDQEVVQALLPVHRAGKEREVRSYSCIFWVRVWDMTPPHAKVRWKSAHDAILEGMFGAYTVTDRPWTELPG